MARKRDGDYDLGLKICEELIRDFGFVLVSKFRQEEYFYIDLVAPNFKLRLSKERAFITIDLASHSELDKWVPLSFLKILFSDRKNFQSEIIPLNDLITFFRDNYSRISEWFSVSRYPRNIAELLELVKDEHFRKSV